MPDMRPRFGNRFLIVAATWAAVALVARYLGPGVALVVSLVPLGLAARSAYRAHAAGQWNSLEHLLKRQVTAVAMLIAATLFAITLWSLRDRVPLWTIPLEIGMLLHYWLLSLA